ncbi:MAG: hypothetical protein OXU70_15230 [Gammaproteobacteria bacterium]|nr:hypothetical protein [Gammaproteobacteria bacterium]
MREVHSVLHAFAIKKFAAIEDAAALTGLDEAQVRTLVAEAVAGGRLNEVGGKYMVTPTAQITLQGVYAKVYGALRGDAGFKKEYEAFEVINDDLKQLMTDWQTLTIAGETVSNDHSDPDYDERIISRLGRLHDRAERLLERLAQHLPRIGYYSEQLLSALEKAEDGDVRWVSDATIGSYHTIWFELHEDLLRVTGLARRE